LSQSGQAVAYFLVLELQKSKSTASPKTPKKLHPTRFGIGQEQSLRYKLARFATNLSYFGNSPISGAT
jgi:hypothetical protein